MIVSIVRIATARYSSIFRAVDALRRFVSSIVSACPPFGKARRRDQRGPPAAISISGCMDSLPPGPAQGPGTLGWRWVVQLELRFCEVT